jgi:hypothetical protein
MKRLIVFAVALTLATLAFALQTPSVSAQEPNCFVHVNHSYGAGTSFRAVQGSAVVSNVILLNNGQSGTLLLNKGTTGSIILQYNSGSGWTDIPLFPLLVANCTDNNNEYANQCGKLGIDFTNYETRGAAQIQLAIFDKNGNPIFINYYTSGTFVTLQQVLPAAFDPLASYTYRLVCVGSGGSCFAGNSPSISPGALIAKGPLTYICPSPCGPGTAGAPLGRMVATVPLYARPGGTPSTFVAEAGKTFKMLGSSGGFTNIALACNSYWVPSEAIVQCADPLCRD